MSNDAVWARYNNIDAAVLHPIWDAIEEDFDDQSWARDIYNWTARLFPPLMHMSKKGLLVDSNGISQMHGELQEEVSELQGRLNELSGRDLNVNSSKQCQQYFYIDLGLPAYTRNKRPTVDDKALARIARKRGKGWEEATLIQRIRNMKKLSSTYLEVETDPDKRIRSFWNPRGTITGRLSSSQTIFGTGMNFQNLDPRFKKFIIADPGGFFVEVDKAKAEWVITAYASGDSRMIEVVESGVDAHAYTGAQITGLTPEKVLMDDDVVGHATDPDEILALRKANIPWIFDEASFVPRIFSARQGGKKSNHGLNYRMQYARFALENEMEEVDAKPLVEGYHNAYPGLVMWWDEVDTQVKRHRYVENFFGRRQRYFSSYNFKLVNDAIAFIPQSTNVDALNRGLVLAYEDERPECRMLDFRAQVHDSILLWFPAGYWTQTAIALRALTEYLTPEITYKGRSFRIANDAKMGLNWGAANQNNPQGMSGLNLDQSISNLAQELEAHYDKKVG